MEYQAWLSGQQDPGMVGIAIIHIDTFRRDYGGDTGVLHCLRSMRGPRQAMLGPTAVV